MTNGEPNPQTEAGNSVPASQDQKGDKAATNTSEDLALAQLKTTDISPEQIEHLSKHSATKNSRKLKLALVEHPRTPRHVSLPMVRHLFTFDLMQAALTPATPPDIKKAAEQALMNRLETISEGEKLSLARRASGAVAGALLLDAQPRVVNAALENPRLTEASVILALMSAGPPAFVQAVCHHPKWSLRRDIRVALLRNQHTPPASASEFARTLPAALVREVMHASRLPEEVKTFLLKEVERIDRNPVA